MSRIHGAQEAPYKQLRFCPECGKNTTHTRWSERAMWTCTEHAVGPKIDLDAYKLMEKRLADAERYNQELLERLRSEDLLVIAERVRACAYVHHLSEDDEVADSASGPCLAQAARDLADGKHYKLTLAVEDAEAWLARIRKAAKQEVPDGG